MYNLGYGVEKNYAEAVKWYRKAADQGDAIAQVWLGLSYSRGTGVTRNYAESLEWFRKASAQGNSYAQNHIGWKYEQGEGVDVDYMEAAKWYKLAVKKENILALSNLGYLYERGLGVKQNYAKAAVLYKRASKLNNVEATHKLAMLYEYGRGVEKNLKLALQYFRKASSGNENYENSVDQNKDRHMANASAARVEEKISKLQTKKFSRIDFGKYYGLLIGNNDYQHLPNLKTALNDAVSVGEVLRKKYNFQITLLKNGTRTQIVKALNRLRKKLGPEDNLLVYYAGHGVYDKDTNTGYWQPVDAEKEDNTQWIRNDRVTTVLKAIKARNVIVVADSCYSGAVLRGISISAIGPEERPSMLRNQNEKKTRIALTSGGLSPVVDSLGGNRHSVFADVFLRALRENLKASTSSEIFQTILEKFKPIMESEGLEQMPEHAGLYKSGHDGGDFIFNPVR
jgi:hypothetical protein